MRTAGLPANQQQDGDLPHLVLCTWLPPSAAPSAGSAFTPQGKPSLLRELCNKIKSNNNPQPSPVQSDRQLLLWGHSSRYPGERRDVTCGAWWLQIALSDQQGPERSKGRVSRAEGSRGIWSQQGMSSPESPGLVNGCSSVTMPGPNTRASGTRRGPSATQTSARVWASPQPSSPLPRTLHSSFSMSCCSLLICAIHWLLSSTQIPARGRAELSSKNLYHSKSLLKTQKPSKPLT